MRVLKQHDAKDCGAVCLAIIADHYGLKCPISKLRNMTKTGSEGTNLFGIVDAAQKIGFITEALSGESSDLLSSINNNEVMFPFIAHIITEDSTQHFVVVASIDNETFTIIDPAKGKVKYTHEKFFNMWTGYIATFKKSDSFKPGNYNKNSFKRFFYLLSGQYNKLVTVLILSLLISAIGIVGAFVFKLFIDGYYSTNTLTINFNLFFIGMIFLYILQALIQFFRGYLIANVSKAIDVRLMIPYYNHIMDLSVCDINTRNTGEYLSRFSDASSIRDAVSGATLTMLLDSIMVIACGIILCLENRLLFCISLLIVIIYAIVTLCYRKPLKNMNRQIMENNARVQSYLKESIDGIETIKAYGAENIAKKRNRSKFTSLIKSAFKSNIISISQDSICDAVELIGIAVILWVGFDLTIKGIISIGSLVTFYALLAYFTQPIKNLIELQPMMQTAIVAAERLNDVLDIEIEASKKTNSNKLEWKSIEFSNVNFRYGNNELTLNSISLDIKCGERIAIVGESGSGKTTLAKLLLKFYSCEQGTIKIDNISIDNLSVSDVRANVSYVDQNTFLFSDSIKNNLLISNPSATDKEIKNACISANVLDFIESLPFGFDSCIDENGKNLSGGQKQRLAIARALLKNPKLLILDEATSNLDTITETAIKNTIFGLSGDLTCIIIAHRLSTIQNCDRIVVMDRGSIVEIGSHNELINKKGYYYNLYNKS